LVDDRFLENLVLGVFVFCSLAIDVSEFLSSFVLYLLKQHFVALIMSGTFQFLYLVVSSFEHFGFRSNRLESLIDSYRRMLHITLHVL